MRYHEHPAANNLMHGKPDGTGPSERRSRPRLVSGRGPPLRGGKDSPEMGSGGKPCVLCRPLLPSAVS